MNEIDKILGALEIGEKLMTGGKRVAELGKLAAERAGEGRCVACGGEEAIEGMPLGRECAKRAASALIDVVGAKKKEPR